MIATAWLLMCLAAALAADQEPSAEAIRRFQEGVDLQQAAKWDAAAAAYRSALAASPRFAEAHANLGAVLAHLGLYAEAVASEEEALRLAPELSAVHLNLGIAHLRAGQFAKAVTSIERYLEGAPRSVQARGLLGIALVETGRHAEAVPHLERVVSEGSDDPGVLLSLGIAYARLGRPEADAIARRLAETDAGRPVYHLLRGLALQQQEHHGAALEELDLAASEGLDSARLHLARGYSLLILGRSRDAIAAFEKAVADAPAESQGFYYLAYAYEREGDIARCRENALTAHRLAPDSPEVDALLGKALLEDGAAGEATSYLEAAVRAEPKQTQTRYLLARAYRALGRRVDAARELKQVQDLMDAGYRDEVAFPASRPPEPKR